MTKDYSDKEVFEFFEPESKWCPDDSPQNYESQQNPTLDLEFMLERLLRKKYGVNIINNADFDKRIVQVYNFLAGECYFYQAKTPTLALRGAVHKLMEKEEEK